MALFEQALDQPLFARKPSRVLVTGNQNRLRTERSVQGLEYIAAEEDLDLDRHAGLIRDAAQAVREKLDVHGRVVKRQWIRNHLHVNKTDAGVEFGGHSLRHFQRAQCFGG